ncbi:NUDIX hydrolase [Agrobacterium tumefaciens]|uniref:8-oxo-dGTP diphosphatase n=1 Tax=Pedobacter psychrotolerans TaxID=1843235 RepID=A0A4R2HL88_9SPHI|nr:NUDIX domain-containing protein [Pedobacter psychrotolerans]NTD99970.1 NUDIX hydrolase [Agrobacterium tumefaciens]NTE25273.1 NUDIX hydrolase [Agrobacterium tumefaciens]TCO30869.1 8-oxo-dGTP diphosphatase [Pedobacter psychrotolerans]GGE43901.1 DNA mismatch repair protein MutT [Pedobacter psychrotolerans]
MEEILPHLDSVFSIDCVLFGFDGKELKILLIERNEEPFKDWWALPGNIVGADESLDQSAARILYELTGLRGIYMEQYYAFGDPNRHPQGRVITLAYYALIRLGGDKEPRPISTYAKRANWMPITDLPKLAFDHQKIYDKGLEKIKRRIKHQPIAFELLPEKFTLTQLQHVYELILGKKLDKRNFRKKIVSFGVLKELDEKQKGVSYRAATLYRFDKRKYAKLFGKEISF